jgi:hypothetical protein
MPDRVLFSEKLETGDKILNDQTVTLRVHHAKKKVRGKLLTQCSGGCGRYLTEEEKLEHQCPGPHRSKPPKRKSHKNKLLKSMRKADKVGKLLEFIAKF